jgi:MFS family permease
VVSVSENVVPIQRRTRRLLVGTQILGGMGTAIGIAVGALLAARLGGTAVSGFASSAMVIGAALLAVPISKIMSRSGRRPGLAFAYFAGAAGAVVVVWATALDSVPLMFAGMAAFGGGTAAGLQARYTAVDLADAEHRGRDLSFVVWATTLGAVAAPNFAELADTAASRLGLPELAGPFAFSAVAFVLAAVLVLALLRPDPLLTARRLVGAAPGAHKASMRAGLRAVTASPAARLGVSAVAVGHVVMVGVMSMTPVHIDMGPAHGDVLRIVGLVLSVHIVGMYALSPVAGWLTDRLGRRPVVLIGTGLLVLACAVAGTAGHRTGWLTVGLFLLGLGWSCTMVAGSTLLSESVPVDVRPAAQGLSDLMMGVAGAAAGAVSGFVVEFSGYAVLNLLAATAVVPLVALALRPVRAPSLGV